jgi:hypothetical protein
VCSTVYGCASKMCVFIAKARSAKALCENSTIFAESFVRTKTTCGKKHIKEVQMLLLCRGFSEDFLLQPTGTESAS